MGNDYGAGDEAPSHGVWVDGFAIDQYEVTNAMYRGCVDRLGCNPPRSSATSTRPDYYDNPTYDNYPVINVTWDDAKFYCERNGMRLPTEAEWEKAARGGLDNKEFPWGNEEPICAQGSKIGANFLDCHLGDTLPVGSFAANNYGLYDMSGNVWEWVADYFAPYDNGAANNPAGPSLGVERVVRGGSWNERDLIVRVARRGWSKPDNWNNVYGFRCARTRR